MSTRNERLSDKMVSLDGLIEDGAIDPDKSMLFSDYGEGAAKIRAFDEDLEEQEETAAIKEQKCRAGKVSAAVMRLKAAGLAYLIPTLMLIIKNRNNREESIWLMTRSRNNQNYGTRQKSSTSDIATN